MPKTIKKNVSEPWFSLMKCNLKKVEGRLCKGDFSKLEKGDIIIWTNNEMGFKRQFSTKVTRINEYQDFKTYLEVETLKKCLPGIDSFLQGLNIYYKYFTKAQEKQFNVIAIGIKLI